MGGILQTIMVSIAGILIYGRIFLQLAGICFGASDLVREATVAHLASVCGNDQAMQPVLLRFFNSPASSSCVWVTSSELEAIWNLRDTAKYHDTGGRHSIILESIYVQDLKIAIDLWKR